VPVVDPVFSGGVSTEFEKRLASGGEEIWVEGSLDPDLFFKNQAVWPSTGG
jgi:hypothetical protein